MGKSERFGLSFVDAMNRLLLRNPDNLTGVVLRLAWCEGLTRDEICGLTWDRIDFKRKKIVLKDREVPFEGDMKNCLCLWQETCPKGVLYVAVSTKTKACVAPQHISRLVRDALNEEGFDSVKLLDLRNQYILWQVDKYGWEKAICNAGISVTTFRCKYSVGENKKASPAVKNVFKEKQKIERLLENNKGSAEGLALWLSMRGGLNYGEIASLTWEQVDFVRKIISLDDRQIALSEDLIAVLRVEKQRRADGEDDHVVLSPRARKPLSQDRLSVIVRSMLLHAGVSTSLPDMKRDRESESINGRITDYCAAHGGISLHECMELMGMTQAVAIRALNALVAAKTLARAGGKYHLYKDVVSPEDYEDTIIEYMKRNGPSTRREIKELLHIGERPTWKLLTQMVKEGKLKKPMRSENYTLL